MDEESKVNEADKLVYFIAVHPDPSVVCHLVSAFLRSGWKLYGELKTFQGISEDGFHRVHYVQVVERGTP